MEGKKITIYAEALENEALEQFYKAMSLPCNVQGALMPDAHSGYTLPIGAVIKSKDKVFPSYVGYDIGCGMCAIKTNVHIDSINLEDLKEHILKKIPIGRDTHTEKQKIPKLPERTKLADEILTNTGVYQLGTLGGGNHFIEIGIGDDKLLNVIIHSGSRGLGKKIAEHYMKEAARREFIKRLAKRVAEHYMKEAAIEDADKERYEKEFEEKNHWKDRNPKGYQKAKSEFVYRRTRACLNTNIEGHYGFDINSESGKAYLQDLEFALEFALANRKVMIDNIVASIEEVLGKKILTERFINRNHNHAELKDGYVIHRKGATHAEKGMMGVIPGNMKDGSFVVIGKGNDDSICSSSHGAGRVLSRNKAKALLNYAEFISDMSGIVSNHTEATLDESPKAYKNIFEVMELQKELVDIVEHIVPVLNIKG